MHIYDNVYLIISFIIVQKEIKEKEYDLNEISSHFEGWLPNLLYRNREYDKNIRQILFRVGYTIQFNKESEFTDKSTLLLVLIRSSNHIIHKLSLKTLTFSSYFVEGKRYDRGVSIKEKYQRNPSVLSDPNKYGFIYREYYLRSTFLPNPTYSKKEMYKTNDNRIKYSCSAYYLYSNDIRSIVEEECFRNSSYKEKHGIQLHEIEIEKILHKKWELEDSKVRHEYEMLAFIDGIRFVEETGERYDRYQKLVNEESDFIKKEELVSKICHWKQIVNDYMIRIHQEKYIPFILCFTDTTKQIFIEYSDESLCELIEIMENDSIEGMMKLIDDNVIKFIQWRISKQLKKELGVEFAEMEEEMEQQIDAGEKGEKEKEGKNDDNNSILKRKYGDEEFSKSLITIDDVKNEEYYEILH